MPEFLETTVDKFTFKVATSRLYAQGRLWIKPEDGLARIGLSDYLQQTSGDVAFADVEPEGTALTPGDDLASVETIKVDLPVAHQRRHQTADDPHLQPHP